MSQLKVGVFVDAENIKFNGGYNLRYDVLRRFAARNSGHLLRLNMYLAFDADRAKEDTEYARKTYNYHNTLRDFGWKVITKNVKRYTDAEGNVTTKANSDLEMAVDAMLQAAVRNDSYGVSHRTDKACFNSKNVFHLILLSRSEVPDNALQFFLMHFLIF